MFEYLDDEEYKTLNQFKSKPRAIISCMASPYVNPVRDIISDHPALIWPDLCKHYFEIEPLPNQNAMDVFYGECLFRYEEFERSAEYGNFKALVRLSKQAVLDENKELAIDYIEKTAKFYGAPGHAFCLLVYKFLADRAEGAAAEQMELNTKAYCHLLSFEEKHSFSGLALKQTGWGEEIVSEHGSFEEFIKQEKAWFENISQETVEELEIDPPRAGIHI